MEQLSLFDAPTQENPQEIISRLSAKFSIKKQKRFFCCLNGQWIETWLWGKVVSFCNGDTYQAARVFYRALEKGSKNINSWVIKGMLAPDYYAHNESKSEFENPKQVAAWCDKFLKVKDY